MSAPLDLIASDDDAPAVVVKRFRRSRQPSSDAQQSTADSSDNSFVVIAEDTHIAPSSKGGPSTPPPCIAQGRLSEPKHRVSQQKGVGKIRPKLPALHSGSWPLPVLPPRAPPLPQGDSLGHPVPPPKATPRSLLFRPPDEPRPSSTVHSWSVKDWFADPSHALKTYKPVIPRYGIYHITQRMAECAIRFRSCLRRTADASTLHLQLQRSAAPEAHVQQILANFSPGTLERYLSCTASFLDLHLSEGGIHSEVSPALLADYLHAAQRSVVQECGVHRTSPVMCIKALRWWAKHCSWQELSEAMQSPLVSAYSRSAAIRDKREAVPIPLAVLAAWERMVCDTDCAQPIRLFLGTALLCCHGSETYSELAAQVCTAHAQLLKLQNRASHSPAPGTALLAASFHPRGFYIGWQSSHVCQNRAASAKPRTQNRTSCS